MLFATFPPFRAVIVSSASSGLSSTSRISICSNPSIVLAARQCEIERRACAGLARSPYPPAMPRHDAMHQRESYASTLEFALIVQSLEDAKELGCVARIESRTIIAHAVSVL